MKCSVVILNWNGEQMLRRYLPSVMTHSQRKDVEIVVADNGSTDTSLEVLRMDFPSVRTIQLGSNYGFAGGYNKAIQQIDSDYTLLLNSDVEVTEGWLDTLLTYMDKHPQVAAVQPKVLSWSSKKEHTVNPTRSICFEHAGAAGGFIDVLGYPFCRGRMVDYVEDDDGQYDSEATIFWASGACMCVRTHVYREVGGLDDEFFAHMEEIDLCWRMNSRGWEVVCLPDSVVYHLGGGSLPYNSPRKTYLNFRNNLLMLYKNLPTGRLWGVMIVRFVLDYVAALQMFLTGQRDNARSAIKARWDFLRLRHTSSFIQKRKENMCKMTVSAPATIIRRSVIVDYYLRGKRK